MRITPSPIDRQRFFLVFNPNAGMSREAMVDDLAAHLRAAGASVAYGRATSLGDARMAVAEAARSGAYDAIVAAGGDGTIRNAAMAVAGTTCPLGAVMLGTGNVLAYELGLPRTMAACAALLRTGPAQPIDLGRVNGEAFLLMASAGLDGHAIAALDARLKRLIGRAAFGPAVMTAVAAPLQTLDVVLDGQHHAATWAIVTRAQHYAGAFTLTRRASLRGTGLQAVLFHASNRADLVRHLYWLATDQLDRRRSQVGGGVTIIACRAAQISSPVTIPAQVDGDPFGTTPLMIDADGGRVQLIVPES